MGQETGTLNRSQFAWIGLNALVDVREIIKPNDPRFGNRTELASVFVLKNRIARIVRYNPRDPRDPSKGVYPVYKDGDSALVGRSVWIESQFLKQTGLNKSFEIKGEEVEFGKAHFSRGKIQDYWGLFCERYSEIEIRALKQQPRDFWRLVDDTLASACEECGISMKVGWIICDFSTELGLRTRKPEHQAAIDRLHVITWNKKRP